MKSLWWVLLLPVMVLAACGGDTTETEPTQTPEPPPTQALSDPKVGGYAPGVPTPAQPPPVTPVFESSSYTHACP